MLTCVYRPPGSCSESFLDQFLNLLEYLSSVSPSFLICGDFNIHVDTSSNDSIKFQNCLESCNITQNVQTATHLHGHILDLVLTPTDASVISNVRVAEFISDHALVLSTNLSATPVTRSLLGICKSTVKGLYCQLPMTQLKHMISLALTLSPYPQLSAV